jgi:transposase
VRKGICLATRDNDPKHTSHMCNNYLRRNQEKVDLVVMDFPPQSRELILIENLWKNLKREKVKHDPTSKENVWDVLNQCWNNLKPAVLP